MQIKQEEIDQLRVLIERLGSVAGAAFKALDDGQELPSGRSVISAADYRVLCDALDETDLTAVVPGPYVYDGWLTTLVTIRNLLDKVCGISTHPESHIKVIRPVMVLGEKGIVVAEELTIYSYRSKPKTGGFDNSRDDGIAVLHKPTGLEGRSHKYRSEHACRNEAMALLKTKLIERLSSCEHGYQNPTGCPVCQGIKP